MRVRLAIVGRPNVGKSTLFNRLAGRRLAIVDDRPGVTRDRRFGAGRLGDIELELIDTAGFEDVTDASLEARMRRQTELAIAEAEVVLFVIDAREGVVPLDRFFAAQLHRAPLEHLDHLLMTQMNTIVVAHGQHATATWRASVRWATARLGKIV